MPPRVTIVNLLNALDDSERDDLVCELRMTALELRHTAAQIDRLLVHVATPPAPRLAPPRIMPIMGRGRS